MIEAIEDPSARFCLGVQWHPENFFRTGEFRSLFEGFVGRPKRTSRSREVTPRLHSPEHSHALDVRRVRKQIESTQVPQRVSGVDQPAGVARQRRDVAGDVDHGAQPDESRPRLLLRQAGSRRIDNQHRRRRAVRGDKGLHRLMDRLDGAAERQRIRLSDIAAAARSPSTAVTVAPRATAAAIENSPAPE